MFKNKLIFNKYKVKTYRNLSHLSLLYEGVNIKDNEPIFIKIEKKNLKYNFLESEAYCLFNLKGFGIPKLISYGKIGLYNILIEELLGKTLHELWKLRNTSQISNIKNVCMVALQTLDRLEYIHSKNYIHRDIKPQNFVTGRKDPNIIYTIDFGFSHQYRSSRTGKHIKYSTKKEVMGSLSYLSINTSRGFEQSRRDDLESLGYMLIFLAKGNLPWLSIEDLEISKVMKFKKIYIFKKKLSAEKLCEGLPEEFAKFINYSRKLDFEENPDYNYLRSLFSSILDRYQGINGIYFFWLKRNNSVKKEEKERNSASLNNINRRKDSSKNRLFKQIKSSLEKNDNQRRTIQQNNLFFEHVNNIHFKPIYQRNYSNNDIIRNYDNIKNISHDEKIINLNDMIISYNDNKFNFNNRPNIRKRIIKDKILKLKPKPINNANNRFIKKFKTKYYFNDESYTNIISPAPNRKSYSNNKYFSTDSLLLDQNKNEMNNIINKKNFNKEIIINENIKQNIFSKEKRIKKILVKRNSNYRTLYEREKEKEKEKSICSAQNKLNLNYFFVNFNSVNQINKNNESMNMQIGLRNRFFNSKDKKENNSQKKFIKIKDNKNFINNCLLKNNRNMKVLTSKNSIKKNLFKNNIKDIHIKKINNNNTYQKMIHRNNSYNFFNNFLRTNYDSKIKIEENNHLYNSLDKNISKIMFHFPKEKKIYNKFKININPIMNNANELLSSDNNLGYINFYSLNSNFFNNNNRISLTQQNKI